MLTRRSKYDRIAYVKVERRNIALQKCLACWPEFPQLSGILQRWPEISSIFRMVSWENIWLLWLQLCYYRGEGEMSCNLISLFELILHLRRRLILTFYLKFIYAITSRYWLKILGVQYSSVQVWYKCITTCPEKSTIAYVSFTLTTDWCIVSTHRSLVTGH